MRVTALGAQKIPPPLPPMEAKLVDSLPDGEGWQFEPKWDGFRCLVFRDGDEVELQSKAGKPLGRYFPEVVEACPVDAGRVRARRRAGHPVGGLSFDALQLRLHPAEAGSASSPRRRPADAVRLPRLEETRLEARPLGRAGRSSCSTRRRADILLSPCTLDRARAWAGSRPRPARRSTASSPSAATGRTSRASGRCSRSSRCAPPTASSAASATARQRRAVGSLLLGLYDEAGKLNHVGFTSAIPADERAALTARLEALIEPPGFTGERAGRAEPLEHRALGRLGAAAARAGRRGALRPRHRRPLPPRHQVPALASRQGARAMPDGSAPA